MSITRRIIFGASASWFSRGVAILLGMILMPVLFRTLPKEELGIWLLLGQSWATLGILDFGFGVTLTRRIAFAKGRSGSDPNAEFTEESRSEIADLVATGVRIYRVLSVLAVLIPFGLGFVYLRSLSLESISLPSVWTAWGILCLCQGMTIWTAPWTALLQGVGYIGWDAILASFISAFTLIGQIITALCGGGLVSLAVVAAIGAVLQRVVIFGFARRKRPELFQLKGTPHFKIFREMAPLAGRAWLTAMGYVIVSNTDQLFISSFQGAAALPAYRGAVVLLINMHFIAGVFTGASPVFVSHLWKDGDLGQIRTILRRNALIGLLSMACGGAVIFALGPALFDLWLGKGNFVGYLVLALLFACFFLEQQANVFGYVGRATNDEAYAWTSLLAAIFKVVFAYLLVGPWGIVGITASTLFAQGLTNYWYMVYRSAIRVGYSLKDHFVGTLLPCALSFVIVFFGAKALTQSLGLHGGLLQVGIIAGYGGCIMVAAFWILVLNGTQRADAVKFLRIKLAK